MIYNFVVFTDTGVSHIEIPAYSYEEAEYDLICQYPNSPVLGFICCENEPESSHTSYDNIPF